MKKMVLLSVLMLTFLLVGFTSPDASIKPNDYRDVTRPDGEDHPWGGEQFDDPTDPLKSFNPPTKWYSPYPIVDLLFTKFINTYLIVTPTKDVNVRRLNNRQISDPYQDYRNNTTSTVSRNN